MKRYTKWVFPVISLAAGALGGFLGKQGMQEVYPFLQKPALTPPAIVFPIVWVVLYVLMGIGMNRVWQTDDPGRQQALGIWALQLAANVGWTVLFFAQQQYLTALWWLGLLWVLILVMIGFFSHIDRTAARLQLPYLLWVSFAAYLNWGIWMLNR